MLPPVNPKSTVQCGNGCVSVGSTPVPGTGFTAHGDTYMVSGSGDMVPYVLVIDALGLGFKGTLVGLIAVICLGAMSITTEFRRGMMIRTTYVASLGVEPRARGKGAGHRAVSRPWQGLRRAAVALKDRRA